MLSARGLGKSYGTLTVLDAVDLAIEPGERIGLVGHNGCGKSTLGRILAGVEEADAGEVVRSQGFEVRYLEQAPHFAADATPRSAVLHRLPRYAEAHARLHATEAAAASGTPEALAAHAAALDGFEAAGGFGYLHRIEAMLGHLGVTELDGPLAQRSGGEKRRVALAALLVSEPELAVLDEPTNHLDIPITEWLEQYLATQFRGALLLITHDRYLLDAVVDRTVEISSGKAYSFAGGWSAYLEQKAEREALAARTEANRQNFLRRELEWLRRSPKARTTKSQSRVDRAHAALAAKPTAGPGALALNGAEAPRLGATIVETRELRLELGGRTLIDKLTLHLREGDRIGIIGPNGAGKTSLFRLLLDEAKPTAGAISCGKHTRIAYLSQHRDGIELDLNLQQNVAGDTGQVILDDKAIDVRAWLERFHFDTAKQRQKASSLSGGERARLAMAQLLARPANLLLLDEPSNDLDVRTLSALEAMLVDGKRTALVITHDRYFLDRIATHILAFDGKGQVLLHTGNYTETMASRAQSQAKTPEPAVTKPRQADEKTKAADTTLKRLTRNEEEELEGLMDRISEAEEALSACAAQLEDPALYTQPEALAEATAARDTAQGQLDKLTARWEALAERAEAQG